MTGKAYTILILARGSSRFRKIKVSTRATVIVGCVALLVLGATLMVPGMIYTNRTQAIAMNELRLSNALLVADKSGWEGALTELSGRLERSEAQATRLATELGVETSMAPASGGMAEDVLDRTVFEQEIESLGRRVETVAASLADVDEAFQSRLRLLSATPNVMPVQGWFSHGFGWRKDPWTGERRFHRGIDIVTESGTPIQAPGDGVVSRTARVSDYGKTIDISHGSGYVTRYAHLSEVLVKTGQQIKRGDVIGQVGSTGRSTGPHLHYEVFRDGRRVNPWKYLGQR